MEPLWLSGKIDYTDEQKEQRIISSQLLELFRINVFGSPEGWIDWGISWSVNENQNKRLFLGGKFTKSEAFDLERGKQVLEFSKKYPIVNFALQALYVTYEYWQGTTGYAEINSLKARLDLLHDNLFALIDAISLRSEEEKKILEQMVAYRLEVEEQEEWVMADLRPLPRFKQTPLTVAANTVFDAFSRNFWNPKPETDNFSQLLSKVIEVQSKALLFTHFELGCDDDEKQLFLEGKFHTNEALNLKEILNLNGEKEAINLYKRWKESTPVDEVETIKKKLEKVHKTSAAPKEATTEKLLLNTETDRDEPIPNLNSIFSVEENTQKERFLKSLYTPKWARQTHTFYQKNDRITCIIETIQKIYASWTEDLPAEDIEKIKQKLTTKHFELIEMQETLFHSQLEKDVSFAQKNGGDPKLKPVPQVAKLYRAIREAKAWAAAQKQIQPKLQLNETENAFYELKNLSGDIVAFLKQGKTKDVRKMEKIAWDLACIFGVEAYFVPTTTTMIHYHQDGIGEKHHPGWRKNHDFRSPNKGIIKRPEDLQKRDFLGLIPYNEIGRGLSGSIQPYLNELELATYLTKPWKQEEREIPNSTLIMSTLIFILFQVRDGHAKNLFVLKDGQLVSMDNTFIFPNGDVVLSEDFLLPAFRSGLLELKGSYDLLTEEQQRQIITQIETFEKKLPEMEAFLKREAFSDNKSPESWEALSENEFQEKLHSLTYKEIREIIKQLERKPEAKKKMELMVEHLKKRVFAKKNKGYQTFEKSLPEHWFDTEKIIEGTKKRLKRAKEACQKGSLNLRDLCFAANPDYKLIAALHLAAFNDLTRRDLDDGQLLAIQKKTLPSVGYHPVQRLVEKCRQKEIDQIALKEACETETFDALIRNLIEKGCYINKKKAEESAEQVLNDFIRKAATDFKEIDIGSLTVTPGRVAVMGDATLLQFKNLGFNLIEWKKNHCTKTLEEEELSSYLTSLWEEQKELATNYLKECSFEYVIAPPADRYYDTNFTLYYKEKNEILSVKIDFTSRPGRLNLEDYATPLLSVEEFKKFCEDLPISLRYRAKGERPLPTNKWNIALERKPGQMCQQYTSIVFIDDD